MRINASETDEPLYMCEFADVCVDTLNLASTGKLLP